MLGIEVEVPLDTIAEAPPNALMFQTDYAQALQRKSANVHELARKYLSMEASRNAIMIRYSLVDSVWLQTVGRRKERNV